MLLKAFLRLRLILAYMLYAVLLNTVGVVLLHSISGLGISKAEGALLPLFKSGASICMSLVAPAILLALGYARSLAMGLAIVGVVCALVWALPSFGMLKVFYLLVGSTFAVVKIAVYGEIGLISDSPRAHVALTNLLEGCFMAGVVLAIWALGLLVEAGANWVLFLGWVAIAAALLAASWLVAPSEGQKAPSRPHAKASWSRDMATITGLLGRKRLYAYVAAIFLYVLIEQSLVVWLPVYSNDVLGLRLGDSIQSGSLLFGFLAIGRLVGAPLIRWSRWFETLAALLALACGLMLIALLWPPPIEAPGGLRLGMLSAALIPLTGLLLAPIYPTLNSVTLSALPGSLHASLMGTIMVASTIGGMAGAFLVGQAFDHIGGRYAFGLTLAAMVVLTGALAAMNLNSRTPAIAGTIPH